MNESNVVATPRLAGRRRRRVGGRSLLATGAVRLLRASTYTYIPEVWGACCVAYLHVPTCSLARLRQERFPSKALAPGLARRRRRAGDVLICPT
jgi:hypothetical protein